MKNFNRSSYEAEMERTAQARKKWNESEWVLGFLRSKQDRLKPITIEEIVEWHQRVSQPSEDCS